MLTVLVLTVFVDLMWAVGVGMVMASLILVKRLSDIDPATHSPLLDVASNIPGMPSLDELPEELLAGVFLVEIHGSLFFGNAGPLQRKLAGIEGSDEVVISLGNVRYLDQSGVYALIDAIEGVHAGGGRVYLCELHEEPRDMLAELELAPGIVPEDRIFKTAVEAITAAALAHGASKADVQRATQLGRAKLLDMLDADVATAGGLES